MADLRHLLAAVACAAATAGAVPAQAEPVTLTAWTIDFVNQYMFTFAKQFEKLHPDIKVNVKHVQFPDINNDLARASVTGDVPDVSYIDNPYIDLFATRGLLLDLAPMIHDSKMPGSVKALQFWQKLMDEKLASPDTLVRGQYDSTATFNAGNAAMAISGPWELPRMSTSAKFDYRVALLPTPSAGGLRVSALDEGDNVILARSKHPKEAFEFVEFLTQQMPLAWNQCGFLPASQVTVTDPKWSAEYALFLQALKTARVRGPSPQWPAISQAIQAALTHQSTAQAALDGAQGQIDSLASQ